MATDSPMSNFNRKNPYVIQAKQQYNILMEIYEKVSKSILINGASTCAVLLIDIIYAFMCKNTVIITLSVLFISSLCILTYHLIKNTIKDSINNDIDKMVTLESNEIMQISIEYVQDLLYKLHECIGKVKAYLKLYKLYNIIITITAIILMINLIMEVV